MLKRTFLSVFASILLLFLRFSQFLDQYLPRESRYNGEGPNLFAPGRDNVYNRMHNV